MRSPPSLSASQRAYTFGREKFLAGIVERAARLYEDGYTVEAGERWHEFLVTPPNTHLPYVVNALRATCTCCFYRRQVEGEPLTEEGTPIACKHLHGLKALLRAECLRLQKQQRWCCYYRLRLQWIGVLYARSQEKQETREQREETSQEASPSPAPLCRHCAAQGKLCETTRNAKGERTQ